MSPWQMAENIVAEYSFGYEEKRRIVNAIAAAIQAESNTQLARQRAGHFGDVREFHQKFGVPIADKPGFPDQATLDLRVKLISEEFCEFLEASGYGINIEVVRCEPNAIEGLPWFGRIFQLISTSVNAPKNFPKAVDGLLDLEYVIQGTHLATGVDPAEPWARVHAANMRKEGDGTIKQPHKITKPPGWVGPDIEGALRDQGFDG